MKVTMYKVKRHVVRLAYCSVLIAVSETGTIFDVANVDEDDWTYRVSR